MQDFCLNLEQGLQAACDFLVSGNDIAEILTEQILIKLDHTGIGGSAVSQNIDLSVITTAFGFFGACLIAGAIIYLFARGTKGKDLESL